MLHTPEYEVVFRSYNPYLARYPGLRVVSRETLHLIKMLRDENYRIKVEPEDGTKLHYFVEKGLRELLADPIVAIILNIPVNIIFNLISNWIYDIWRKPPKEDEVLLVLEFDEEGNKVRYSQSGKPISDEKFQTILASLEKRVNAYGKSQTLTPPEQLRPYPIYLEHTSRIVGWAEQFVHDEHGLWVDGVRIIDREIEDLVEKGYITGFSPGGLIAQSTCSICDGEYTECNHIATKFYDGKECLVRIDNFFLAEFSLVKEPIQPLAIIRKR